MQNCEKKIAQLEDEMKKIEAQLSAPESGTDIEGLTRKYLELKREYDSKMEEWLELANE